MNSITIAKHCEQLQKRREQVALTLDHIRKDQKEAEENTDWLDRAAYESRINLLDRLIEWYTKEMEDLERALGRIEQNRYGVCLACHKVIDEHRLGLFPQTAFCSACKEAREELQNV